MTTPIQRFRRFSLARRRLLEFEALLAALLVVVALLAEDAGGAGQAVAVVALAYAVGLSAHLMLVLLGWHSQPPRQRGRDSA